jgi:hypothetical protein
MEMSIGVDISNGINLLDGIFHSVFDTDKNNLE